MAPEYPTRSLMGPAGLDHCDRSARRTEPGRWHVGHPVHFGTAKAGSNPPMTRPAGRSAETNRDDRVWNRAATEAGGPAPREGDRALANDDTARQLGSAETLIASRYVRVSASLDARVEHSAVGLGPDRQPSIVARAPGSLAPEPGAPIVGPRRAPLDSFPGALLGALGRRSFRPHQLLTVPTRPRSRSI